MAAAPAHTVKYVTHAARLVKSLRARSIYLLHSYLCSLSNLVCSHTFHVIQSYFLYLHFRSVWLTYPQNLSHTHTHTHTHTYTRRDRYLTEITTFQKLGPSCTYVLQVRSPPFRCLSAPAFSYMYNQMSYASKFFVWE